VASSKGTMKNSYQEDVEALGVKRLRLADILEKDNCIDWRYRKIGKEDVRTFIELVKACEWGEDDAGKDGKGKREEKVSVSSVIPQIEVHMQYTNLSSPVLTAMIKGVLAETDPQKVQIGQLWVFHCGLDIKGCQSIAQLIRAHPLLHQVHISHNNRVGVQELVVLIEAAYQAKRGQDGNLHLYINAKQDGSNLTKGRLKAALAEADLGAVRVAFVPHTPNPKSPVHVVVKIADDYSPQHDGGGGDAGDMVQDNHSGYGGKNHRHNYNHRGKGRGRRGGRGRGRRGRGRGRHRGRRKY